tara:strand:- start:654 stop:896 length:243 start_codon:yes stop_codon:yes gene_type:complete
MDRCPTCGKPKVRPGLSEKQTDILKAIKKLIKDNGHSPSFREVAEATGKQKSHVHRVVCILSERGYVQHTPSKNRSLVVL